ncbi:MBL fold metallo-hydrolase [Brevibacillus choshinensis]|uniref:MBL fold metallo-hydrolase n=1 Tax=Brevibacillus choshinensis TaxID=54911 RepID=UPI002E1D68BB|nr:MBL fold metallo-hydrolase [Brevibacillus choshinensis]
MNNHIFGPVEIVMGEKESRTPFSTSLLIRGKEDSTLIDCGGGPSVYTYLLQQTIRQIYVTHYHPDHIGGLSLFTQSQIITNPYDYWRLANPAEMAERSPFELSKSVSHHRSTGRNGKPQLIYPYNQEIDMSGTKVIMIHAPGHCEGFCCPYFPDQGIVLVGDFDLTSFGPWYFSPDSSIDLFIQSARRMLEVDAEVYITSHQKGMVSKAEYRERIEPYLDVIERREEKIRQLVRNGCPPAELIWQDVFFYRKHLDLQPAFLWMELMGLSKHLKRMIKHGEPFEDYFDQFVTVHQLREEFIDCFREPTFAGSALPVSQK